MNSTDRSIGHIDYAVRRRFSFYTLSSSREAIEEYYSKSNHTDKETKDIAIKLFDSIRNFVECNKSIEFDIEDLMVGHSYFMAKDKDSLKLKLCYDIIPLLKEYEKDGFIALDSEKRKSIGKEWIELFPMI